MSSGLIVPANLAAAVFRLMIAVEPSLAEFQPIVPSLCLSIQHFQTTWIVPAYYMSLSAILFR